MLPRRFSARLDRAQQAVAALEIPPAVYKTCPFEPRDLVEEGLRQWLRCCGAALLDSQLIGMPSHAADEAWHGLILCTARYSSFCEAAYGRFLHHSPQGGEPPGHRQKAGTREDQLRRTAVAWSFVARPGEECVLWDLDLRVGVAGPWSTRSPLATGNEPGRQPG